MDSKKPLFYVDFIESTQMNSRQNSQFLLTNLEISKITSNLLDVC